MTLFEDNLSKLEQIRYIENPEYFYKETAYWKKVDNKFTYYFHFSKIKSRVGNKGSGYLTHGFDLYKGNFHGQMVRGLINCCNLKKKSLLLDPFCGSGTSLIEAKLLGFNSIGIDNNPIACLNTKIKTELLDTPLNSLLSNNEKFLNLHYYQKKYPIQGNFNDFLSSQIPKLFHTFLYMRALSEETYYSRNREVSLRQNFFKVIKTLKAFKTLKSTIKLNFGKSNVVFDDSNTYLKKLPSKFIDAVVTSPPYLNLIDYIKNDFVQINNLIKPSEIKIIRKRAIGRTCQSEVITKKQYMFEMDLVFNNIKRILKPNSYFILVIGSYKDLKELFINLAKKHDFYIERILMRKVINLRREGNLEYVLFLKK